MNMSTLQFTALCGSTFDQASQRMSADVAPSILSSIGDASSHVHRSKHATESLPLLRLLLSDVTASPPSLPPFLPSPRPRLQPAVVIVSLLLAALLRWPGRSLLHPTDILVYRAVLPHPLPGPPQHCHHHLQRALPTLRIRRLPRADLHRHGVCADSALRLRHGRSSPRCPPGHLGCHTRLLQRRSRAPHRHHSPGAPPPVNPKSQAPSPKPRAPSLEPQASSPKPRVPSLKPQAPQA